MEHVRIDRGTDVPVTEQLLHRPNVVAVLEQVRREAMTDRVRPGVLRDPRPANRRGDCFLHRRFMQVEPRRRPPFRIRADRRGGEHELPSPFRRRVRIFSLQGIRQHDPPESVLEIGRMQAANLCKMLPKRINRRSGQRRRSVLLPFAAPDRDLASIEIDIFHPQFQAFLQAQAGTVEQHADDPHRAVQVR